MKKNLLLYLVILFSYNVSKAFNYYTSVNAQISPDTCIGSVPSHPGSIIVTGGIARVGKGDTRTYSTAMAAGVSWIWTVPAGATINSGQGSRSINVTYGNNFNANGIISVVKINACGRSLPRKLTIIRNIPAIQGWRDVQRFVEVNETTVTKLYPSPASDHIVIKLFSEENSKGRVCINDMLGNELINHVFNIEPGFNEHNIDLSRLAKGIYLARIANNNDEKVIRFVKE